MLLGSMFLLSETLTGGGHAKPIEFGLARPHDLVFFGEFDENFKDDHWIDNWGIPWSNRISLGTVVGSDLGGSQALRVDYPIGGVGPDETGIQFPIVFRNMANPGAGHYDSLYLRYYLKFEEGFDFVKGGKLPGLMGGGDSWSRSGGNQPDGTNGWTLRLMWRTGGRLVVYAYVPPSENGRWGSEKWGQDIEIHYTAKPGIWHCIEQYVNVGTPGHDDGQLKIWIDDVERLSLNDMRFRDVDNNEGRVGGIFFSTFHGGSEPDWAPSELSYVQFYGLVAATNRVGMIQPRYAFSEWLSDHNLPPVSDPNDDVHKTGRTLFHDYAFGIAPTDLHTDAVLHLELINPNELVFSYPDVQSQLEYMVRSTFDLLNWTEEFAAAGNGEKKELSLDYNSVEPFFEVQIHNPG